MGTTLLNIDDVCKRRSRSRAQTYRDIAEGRFSPGVKISTKVRRWTEDEVNANIEAEIAAARAQQQTQK